MPYTNYSFARRTAGILGGVLVAIVAFEFAAHLAGPVAGILLVGVIIAIVRGLSRGMFQMAAARASGDPDALAQSRVAMRPYEVGCLAIILGVFAMCLSPVFIGPPHRAPLSISLNNIKQLAIGVMTYSQDYNENFPGWVRNPDGAYAHNTWDEQIDPCIKSKDTYNNLPYVRRGIRSYSQTGTHHRVLTYGLNGLLITPPKAIPDGDADFASVNASHPPQPFSPSTVANPGDTILFAELSTASRMPGEYGRAPDPRPFTYNSGQPKEYWKSAPPERWSAEWTNAFDGWIDISPRAFIEMARGWRTNPYKEPYGRNADCGVARDLYGGGGCYAFCDGHVQFIKIGQSVGLGTTTKEGIKIAEDNCWSAENTNNMWIPR
jgi:prepilin-type processing-associated H-X9-DG protein